MVLAVAVLGLALLIGVGIGRRRAAEELTDDPVGALETERLAIRAQAQALAPPLHGRGSAPLPELQALEAVRARLDALNARAVALAVPLDTLDTTAALVRARFELALRRGDPAALEEAAGYLSEVGHRGEEPILKARLQLARGETPDASWLGAWVDAEDPSVAEAARLLTAELTAAQNPDRARRLVSERVDPVLAKRVLVRVELAAAARRLEPGPLRIQLSLLGAAPATPGLRTEIARGALAEATGGSPSPLLLSRSLEVIGLLRGEIGPEGQRLARAALVVARRAQSELGLDEEGRPRREADLGTLLAALESSGLRAGPCAEGAGFLDDLLDAALTLPPELLRAGLRVALRLDLRLHPVHLQVLAPLQEGLLSASDPRERALGLRLRGRVSLADVETLEGALPPAQRAQLLLAVQAALPTGPEQRALCARALELDPGSPHALLACLRSESEPPGSDALSRLSEAVRGMVRGRERLEPEGVALLADLAHLQRERGQSAAADATLEEVERWFGPEARARARSRSRGD